MYQFRQNEVILLLGAGASKDAHIPHSTDMVRKVEALIENEWEQYRTLYNYIKSSVYYADGIRGRFEADVNYNIERIVNTLEELAKKEEHPLYPFVGAWNPTLLEVAGDNFGQLHAFRREIVKRLRNKWITLEYKEHADYYQGLLTFQSQYEYPLRVFSLNYDLCVESQCEEDFLERGFEGKFWDWKRFGLNERNIYLHKLHGSTDWVREKDKLTYKNDPAQIDHDQVEIIFGTTYKLQYVDPFLFFAYELRKWTLSEAKLIVSIGYGFGDDHINGILAQALNSNEDKMLLSVAPINHSKEKMAERIANKLDVNLPNQIKCCDSTAADFLSNKLSIEYLAEEIMPEPEKLFVEVLSTAEEEE